MVKGRIAEGKLEGFAAPPWNQDSDKVAVRPTDPDAALGRNKLNVFRPLYPMQVVRDLDSPLVLAHEVLTRINDNGVIKALVEHITDQVGHKPEIMLVDSGYVSLHHLEFCATADIALLGPVQVNDYSGASGKRKQCDRKTMLPKSAFRWLPEEQTRWSATTSWPPLNMLPGRRITSSCNLHEVSHRQPVAACAGHTLGWAWIAGNTCRGRRFSPSDRSRAVAIRPGKRMRDRQQGRGLPAPLQCRPVRSPFLSGYG